MNQILSLGLFALAFTASQAVAQPVLKEAFAQHFKIGAALGTKQINGEEPRSLELVAQHFNTITPENAMKWAGLHPQPGVYDFATADRFVDFGEQHGMFIVGHTLIWHSQTPDWVFEDDRGQSVSREVLLGRMEEHIRTVVGRYQGRVHAYDVVNEAIGEAHGEGTGERRPSKWQTIIGDDYIEQAFRFAHAADPEAELYYNEFSLIRSKKRGAVIQLVKSLQAKGVRIDGVGAQCHIKMDWPRIGRTKAMLDDLIAQLKPLGIKVMVTELDVDTSENNQALVDRYTALFRLFNERSADIDRVTFWGVHDGQSWRNRADRKSYPLLFDRQLKPKQPLFDAVIETE